MLASTIFGLVRRFGPYLGLALLAGMLYVEHLRLTASDDKNIALTMANTQYRQATKVQTASIDLAHKDQLMLVKQMSIYQKLVNKRQRKVATQIRRIEKSAPIGTCQQDMDWAVKQNGRL